MKVISYLQGVPKHNTNDQKTQLLKKFIDGVNLSKDTGIAHNLLTVLDSDVAVIQGWVYNNLTTVHLKFRKQIIDTQREKNKNLIIADANCFKFKDPVSTYIKYSFNGIFPTTGNYCDSVIDRSRWQSISNNLNLSIQPYKTQGKFIVLLMQRSGGWSMKGLDNYDWFRNTVKKIRKYSDRPIIVRPHPGDKIAKRYLHKIWQDKLQDIYISENKSIENDLKDSWAVVNHNSSATVYNFVIYIHAEFETVTRT